MTDFETLTLERPRPGVALATLNRPERLNAMNAAMFADLQALGAQITADDTVRALVVTGAGRGFCSGFDLNDAHELGDLGPREMIAFQDEAAASVTALHAIPKPVIAAINGPAAGGGLALALAADIRLAAQDATLTAIFVRVGFSAGDLGASWYLPRIVGLGVAAELMFTGRAVPAGEALGLGLVNRVVAPEGLVDAALDLGAEIAANSPLAVRMSKRSLYANVDAPSLHTAIELENRGQSLMSPGPDVAEALAAAAEGRPPVFPD